MLKKKSNLLSHSFISSVNRELTYETFLLLLNEVNDSEFYDSGVHFKGNLLGLELRTSSPIKHSSSEDVLAVFLELEKKK